MASWPGWARVLCFAVALACPAAAVARPVQAAEAAPARLMLDVELNGQRIGLLGDFQLSADNRLSATVDELASLGIDAARVAHGRSSVALDDIPGLRYRYDEPNQSIAITCPPALLRETSVSTYQMRAVGPLSPTATGVVLNYAALATTRTGPHPGVDITAQLDGRVFGKFGLISGSAIATAIAGQPGGFVRLDTSWTIESTTHMTAWRIGDSINSGLSWTRPVRFAGIQYGRRFDLRPDLITAPLPVIRGTAALPSSVDLYIDGARTFSSQIPAGPFALRYTPGSLGAVASQLVVTDALGRQSSLDLSFYASDALLAPKLFDFSMEAGFARRDFGIYSNAYSSHPLGSATLRYGLTRKVTVQGHVEATRGLLNVGAGGIFNFFDVALGTFSAAYSNRNGVSGQHVEIGVESRSGPLSLSARVTRSYGQYGDLASATAIVAAADRNAFAPARATEQVQLSSRLWTQQAMASISYMHIVGADTRTRLLGVSFTQRIGAATLSMRATQDFEDHHRRSLSIGLSMPFGGRSYASAQAFSDGGRVAVVTEASSGPASNPGDLAWRATVAAGAIDEQSAALSYMTQVGRGEVGVRRSNGAIGMFAQAEGGIAFVDGHFFPSRRIDDAFAVVDVGAKGVPVTIENRLVGKTSGNGRLLVPQLAAYSPNRIAIDPGALPIDRDVAVDSFVVTPRRGVGTVLRIAASGVGNAALVTFVDGRGVALPPGSVGTTIAADGSFVIGYDGETYIEGLSPINTVRIEDITGKLCIAHFAYKRQPGGQIRLGPVKCLPFTLAQR